MFCVYYSIWLTIFPVVPTLQRVTTLCADAQTSLRLLFLAGHHRGYVALLNILTHFA